MATVIPLPARFGATPPSLQNAENLPPIAATYGRFGEYALADVARRLGLLHFGVRTIVDKLRILAAKDGMPLPRTVRVSRGERQRGPLVIYSKSRWDAEEFDAWYDGQGPAGGGAAAPRPLSAPIRAAMSERAAQIASAA